MSCSFVAPYTSSPLLKPEPTAPVPSTIPDSSKPRIRGRGWWSLPSRVSASQLPLRRPLRGPAVARRRALAEGGFQFRSRPVGRIAELALLSHFLLTCFRCRHFAYARGAESLSGAACRQDRCCRSTHLLHKENELSQSRVHSLRCLRPWTQMQRPNDIDVDHHYDGEAKNLPWEYSR